jgi:hypothetical protein
MCVIVKPRKMRRPRPTRGCCDMKKRENVRTGITKYYIPNQLKLRSKNNAIFRELPYVFMLYRGAVLITD